MDFTLENYGPFRDRTSLSFQATARKEHQKNIIPCDAVKGGILSSVIVFGPNASGKSYVFKAIRSLVRMVLDAFPDGTEYPWYKPFRLNDENPRKPVSFEIRFVDDGILYDYSISFDQRSIVSESLVYRSSRRPVTAFRRGGSDEKFNKKQQRMKEFLTSSTAFLVIGAKYNDELCAKVRNMILSLIVLESAEIIKMARISCAWAADDPEKKSMLIDGLRKADLAIVDFESTERAIDRESIRSEIPPKYFDKMPSEIKLNDIRLMHGYEGTALKGKKIPFEMDDESTGTMSMFGIMGPLSDALINGKTLVIDEFGAYLHPILTRWLVSQFSAENNPNRAQLIAMTHDIGLMDTDELLRRDQIFFTDKNREDGSAELYCLSDFKGVRKEEIVLKSYMFGRYDAIPDISVRGLMDGFRNRQVSQERDPQKNSGRYHHGRRSIRT